MAIAAGNVLIACAAMRATGRIAVVVHGMVSLALMMLLVSNELASR